MKPSWRVAAILRDLADRTDLGIRWGWHAVVAAVVLSVAAAAMVKVCLMMGGE